MGATITPTGGAPASLPARAGVTGGGGSSLSTALADLTAAVAKLQAAVDALAGATSVQGGGGMTPSQGCSCDPGSTQAALAPPGKGADGGMKAEAPQKSQNDPAPPPAPPAPPAPGDTKGGDVRQRIVDAARAELARGVTEDAGPDKDKAGRIREYRTAVTGAGENPDDAEAWCADFASWIRKQAGAAFGPGGTGEDYTPAMITKAKAEGTWHERGTYDPKPGDLVMIDWQGGTDVDHVAVIEKVENGKIYTIAGNESNRVKSASYPVDDKRLMGFINPPGA